MFCEKCGNELQENEKVCAKCGAPVVEMAPSQEQSQAELPAVSESNSTKNTPEDRSFKTPESGCHFMGVLASVITIIFGFVLKSGKIGGITVEHITYGGDAFTGIQNAAADTAIAVQNGFAYVLIAIGVLAFFFFLGKLVVCLESDK